MTYNLSQWNRWLHRNSTGYLYVDSGTSAIRFISDSSWANGKMAAFYRNGGVELYYDNSKSLRLQVRV
ncbi:hypothetical protein, partial [uncultured phage MedDCM-OCT-S08-C239]